jgi:Inner membrane component of T3SS, cytoplasmic domain/Domain of unknown function (DUF4389)
VATVAGARIGVVGGPDAGKEFELSGTMTVGREGDIVVEDPEISRTHASLSWDGTALTVQDLGSTNGTFVNDERLSGPRQLGPSDRLRIGTTVFELRLPAAGADAGDATRAGSLPPDVDATAQRQVPDFAAAPPPSGPPGGAGGPPGGPPPSGPPPSGPPPAGPPPLAGPPPGGPPPAYAPPPSPPPGGPPAPYHAGGLSAAYPINYDVDYPAGGIARWRCFFQGVLAWPHYIVLIFVGIAAYLAFFVAAVAIIFTRRYPVGLFNFVAGTLQWGARVNGYSYLMTEQYPPFALGDVPYPVHAPIAYPEGGIARWRPFLQGIMAFPHILVLYFLWAGALIGSIGAWFSILFTRKYPPGIFNFVVGVQRWSFRVQAYTALMTEQYPPFSLE